MWNYIIPLLHGRIAQFLQKYGFLLPYGLTLGLYMKFQMVEKKVRLAIRSLKPRGPGTGPRSPVKGFLICRRDTPYFT